MLTIIWRQPTVEIYYLGPDRAAKYCYERVCMSVCLYTRRGSVLLWRQCNAMYFRFCGRRYAFAHKGLYGGWL